MKYNSDFKKYFFILFIFLSGTFTTYGQGCSDAGVCTMNSFKPNENDSSNFKNSFKLGVSYGSADHSISVISSYLEYNRKFSEYLSTDLKLISNSQSGNGISTFGISDAFINFNFSLSEKLKLTIGSKIPLNNADNGNNLLPLPMDFQTSLGTLDLILGLGYKLDKLQFVFAYQQPLSQNNNNFYSEFYPLDSPFRQYQSTNKFERSGDALVRISYPLQIGEKLKLTPSILPIYHLSNDKYVNLIGQKEEIVGSQGLTLNVNLFFDYSISNRDAFQLSFGAPLVVRDSRPDGLTRHFVVGIEYRFQF